MKKILILLYTAVICLGCENFLDKHPENNVVAEGYYQTEADAVAGLIGVYNDLQDARYVIHNFNLITSIASGDAWEPNSNALGFTEVERLAVTPTNGDGKTYELFAKVFGSIGKTVRVLKYIPELQASDQIKQELEGEGRFLRALSYYHLVGLFGGMPLLREAPVYGENNVFTRSTAEETWNFIVEDLEYAGKNLPGSRAAADRGRATRGSANGLLARVLAMRAGKDLAIWQKVKDAAQSVIDDGYSLDPNYANNFVASGDYNKESLFEIGFDPKSTDAAGNMISLYNTATFAGGYSYGEATSAAYRNFDSDDFIRRRTAVYMVGDSINFKSTKWTGDNNAEFLTPSSLGFVRAGTAKYNDPNQSTGIGTDANYKMLRFAETLLLMAEAENELGNTASALTYVKKVRDRVNLQTDLTMTSQALVREFIFKERMAELCMEGTKFYDLVQRGRGRDFSPTSFNRDDFVFPIPESEIQKNNWTQNSSMTQQMKDEFMGKIVIDIR